MDKDGNPDLRDDPFCIYAFNAVDIMPSGQVRPCCVFMEVVKKDGRPMSVYEHSLQEIWSSDYWRSIRRDMMAGNPISACSYCYKQEATGTLSMGTMRTRAWKLENPGHDRSRWSEDDFAVASGPESLDLDVGNLCNLKCRMCNSSYSSAIASDPTHSRWAPPGPVAARWKADRSIIAPSTVLGVTYDGFAHATKEDGTTRSWIGERAALKAVISGVGASGFSLRLFAPETTEIEVHANGVSCLRAHIEGVHEQRFDIPELVGSESLELVLNASGRVAVEEIALLRSVRGNSRMPFSRLPGGEPWYQSEEFLTKELLLRPEALRIVRVIGGEPMLIKEARLILRRLIELGVADRIVLGFTTNATHVDDDWFDIFSHFKLVYLALSLDGHGTVNEYIRFPSEWPTIDRNIRLMTGRSNIDVRTNMTIQAYNLLSVIEMFNYCEEVGIQFGWHLLQHPSYLSVSAVPDMVRQVARDRLLTFASNAIVKHGSRNDPSTLVDIASAISSSSYDEAAHGTFDKFTAELDASRGQSMRDSLPELWAMLNEPALAKAAQKRRWWNIPTSGRAKG